MGWDASWQNLQLILEVMQFARDAHFADFWLVNQQHNSDVSTLASPDQEMTLQDVETLLEQHANFERLLEKQEEKVSMLENLTTFELRNARQKQLEEERLAREQEEEAARIKLIEEEKEKQRKEEEAKQELD